ncbi:MAG: EAL domain-containing protein [Microvirga sp.]|nr:EAL domain-containing protein [Microvirga sp.]
MFGLFQSQSKNSKIVGANELSIIPSSKSCLVIDDSPYILDLFRTIIDGLHVEARYVDCERIGIEMIPEFAPALIFLDIRLKEGDCIDVMKELANMRYRGVIQLMSGRYKDFLEQVVEAGSKMGLRMRAPLQKPFRPAQIRSIIREERLVAEILSTRPFPFRQAWDEGWLEVWYQPQIDMRTRTVYGAEALIRARHPVFGPSAPAAFLHDASLDDYVGLTKFVIQDACAFWARMRDEGFNLAISVNASSEILENASIRLAIDKHAPRHVDFPGLSFEVEADDLFQDMARTNRLITQLGIYRSRLVASGLWSRDGDMLRLLEGSLRQIKLSQALVGRMQQDGLSWKFARSLKDYAERTECRICVEGIEVQRQVDALIADGITCGQGVFYSPSVEKDVFLNSLKGRIKLQAGLDAPRGHEQLLAMVGRAKKLRDERKSTG